MCPDGTVNLAAKPYVLEDTLHVYTYTDEPIPPSSSFGAPTKISSLCMCTYDPKATLGALEAAGVLLGEVIVCNNDQESCCPIAEPSRS
jgi:hypothetical protein